MIPTWDLAQSFYKGMNLAVKVNINVITGGTIMSQTLKDTLELLEKMDNTQSLWSNERVIPRKGKVMDMDEMTMMNAKLDALTKKIDKMGLNTISPTLVSSCEFCHGGHFTIECRQM